MYRGGSESGPWTKLNNEEIASPTPGRYGQRLQLHRFDRRSRRDVLVPAGRRMLSGVVASHPPMMVVVNAPTAVKLAGLGAAPALSTAMPLAAIGFALLSGFAVADASAGNHYQIEAGFLREARSLADHRQVFCITPDPGGKYHDNKYSQARCIQNAAAGPQALGSAGHRPGTRPAGLRAGRSADRS